MATLHNALQSPSVASTGSTSTVPDAGFRAPAHKNSHHLHSIPPREKSTRTLIVDHMLWVHGRTRLAQARAELGMADLTGGPSSANYTHRTRPENYYDDDDADEADDTSERRQDLPLARILRLRAEGLEKVVTSMISQPPSLHPTAYHDENNNNSNTRTANRGGRQPHILPNGVRVRLALGTIVNDFFARQAPRPPYRHTREASRSRSRSHSPDHDFPHVLLPLTPISGAFRIHEREDTAAAAAGVEEEEEAEEDEEFHSPPPNSGTDNYSFHHPMGSVTSPPSSYAAPHHHDRRISTMPPPPVPNRAKRKTKPTPSPRTRSLYAAGADPSTANSPPGFRCPRHLYIGCEICVEAKSNDGGSGGGGRAGVVSNPSAAPGGDISGWKEGSGIGTGLLKPDIGGSALRRKVGIEQVYRGREQGKGGKGKGKGKEKEKQASYESKASVGTGAGNTKLGKLIPRFIKLSALVAGELGRELRGEEVDAEGGSDGGESEAGESSGSEAEQSTPTRASSTRRPRPPPTLQKTSPKSKSKFKVNRAHRKMYDHALKPTAEWYSLLGGLLTRAVVEGYLTAGWRGVGAVECLCLVGVGVENERDKAFELLAGNVGGGNDEDDDEDDEEVFEDVEPDESPSLVEAARVLFPSLRDGGLNLNSNPRKGEAEQDYTEEMFHRLRKFYEIPESTPDLSTHMEDMAWQYAAEPVEREAVRFCEAIAVWRGRPELEMYKKDKPQSRRSFSSGTASATSSGTSGANTNNNSNANTDNNNINNNSGSNSSGSNSNNTNFQSMMMPMESLVHSNPTSPTSAHRDAPRSSKISSSRKGVAKGQWKGPPVIGMYFSSSWVRGGEERERERGDERGGGGGGGGQQNQQGQQSQQESQQQRYQRQLLQQQQEQLLKQQQQQQQQRQNGYGDRGDERGSRHQQQQQQQQNVYDERGRQPQPQQQQQQQNGYGEPTWGELIGGRMSGPSQVHGGGEGSGAAGGMSMESAQQMKRVRSEGDEYVDGYGGKRVRI